MATGPANSQTTKPVPTVLFSTLPETARNIFHFMAKTERLDFQTVHATFGPCAKELKKLQQGGYIDILEEGGRVVGYQLTEGGLSEVYAQ